MWKSSVQERTQDEHKVLNWHDFQQEPPLTKENAVLSITAHLRRLLEKYEESEFIKYLVAPSPTALSGFFQCKVRDIYQALQELDLQGYGTETSGDLGPVFLWDPLIRNNTARRQESKTWELFQDLLWSPDRSNVTQ